MAAKARDMMEVHRMLAHPSDDNDNKPVGVLQGALAGESETAGRAVD